MGRCPGGADAITIYEGYKCIKTQRATAMKQPVGRLSRYDPSRKSRSAVGRVQGTVSESNRKNLTIKKG